MTNPESKKLAIAKVELLQQTAMRELPKTVSLLVALEKPYEKKKPSPTGFRRERHQQPAHAH